MLGERCEREGPQGYLSVTCYLRNWKKGTVIYREAEKSGSSCRQIKLDVFQG